MLEQLLSFLCKFCLGWRKEQKQQLTPAGNPLPAVIHKVLHPEDLGPGRLIIVGDIHGCYDALLELLHKVGYKPRHDNLILVGDLVNKGPKSQQVVSTVRAWCEGSYCWVTRGNWDDAALAAGSYVASGGLRSELVPKLAWVDQLLPEDMEFLTELPFSIKVEGYNVVVVHAALLPGVPLEAQPLEVMTKVRDLLQTPDGRWIGLESPEADSQAWAQCWQGPCHVFFGHDAKRNLQDAPYATGLDTGCVYGRQLTACVMPPLSRLGLERDAVRQAGKNNKQHSGAGSSRGAGAHEQPQGVGPAAGWPSATPSLQQLQGELHIVLSTFLYEKKPKDKQKKKLLKQQKKAR